MATSSAPSLDTIEDAILGIAPLLSEFVEPHLRKHAPTGLQGSGDPIHYVHVLASAHGSIPSGSPAEALWRTARVLVATRAYCIRLDPLAAELQQAKRDNGRPLDRKTRLAIERRLQESGGAMDDAAEHKFLSALEQLDGLSLAAQQAVVDKLHYFAQQDPTVVMPPGLLYREEVIADVRALLPALIAAARSAFAVDEQTEFPRTRRQWKTTVARMGADLEQVGLSHRQVGAIFPGNGTGGLDEVGGEAHRARQRARQRTRRLQGRTTAGSKA